jgi:uncharacterized protein (DUF433 family)
VQPIAIIDRGRGPELAGTRVTVFDVIPYLEAGHSPNYVATVFNLATAEVLALMKYIEEHKAEVMAENQKIVERIARGNPPEVEALRAESHAKLLRLRDELRQRSQEGVNGASDPGRQ